MKVKTINIAVESQLDPGRNDGTVVHRYTVQKVTDSVDYLPGQILTKKQVDDLCQSNIWKVALFAVEGSRYFGTIGKDWS